MKKVLNIVRMLIVGILVITSIPLSITWLAGIERQHEFMVVLHVISGILFILVAIPITVNEKRQEQKR
jgi:hypothetical protein